jgi:histidyl-tRNA synthetase
VDRDTLGFYADVEMPLAIGDALSGLPIPPVTIQVNNRKLVEGFLRGVGVPDTDAGMRAIDKLDKIGPAATAELLVATAGATEAQAKACLAFADISAPDGSVADAVTALGVSDPLLDEGLDELVRVVEAARSHRPGLVVAQLKIARGLDYYTGTVYETVMKGYESAGSITSGGRYDNLASTDTEKYPGTGLSVGVSRMLGILFGANALSISRHVPTCVLVALADEESRPAALAIASALRSRGIATEVSPDAAKYGKQIRYADRRGIPYVWFPGVDGMPDEVKDIRSGDQAPANRSSWSPPAEDLIPQISAT